MAKESQPKELSIKHQEFCRAWLLCMNGTKAYMKIYPDSSSESARANAARLLANDSIKAYIQELRGNFENLIGVNKGMVANEHRKIGFGTFANLLNDWMTQKEYDELPEEVIDCIASVETRTIQGEGYTTEEVKIKLYDKQKSLSELSKLFGYYDPEKVDLGDIGQIALFQIPSNNRDAKPES